MPSYRERRSFLRDFSGLICLLLALLIIIFSAGRGIMVGEADAIRVAETSGYTEVKVERKFWLFPGVRGCGGDDAAGFDMSAINPVGKSARITVCMGWPFKGGTVRVN